MKKTRYYLLPLVALLLCSCAGHPAGPVYVKEGKEYGKVRGAFRDRWWNYYERGISYAEGQFNKEAIQDFKVAVKKRDKDQRMARTYGMHFIDYFPHRELGLVYYQMGNLADAKKELELSLSQFSSSKARFYLDRVRKRLIEQEVREIMPPRLTVSFQGEEFWTREDPVVISGIAEDDHYVSGIKIMGSPLYLEGSQKRIAFKEAVVLSQGQHAIEVEAKNLMGIVVRSKAVIHVDREGPIIAVETLRSSPGTSGKEVIIQGSIYDEAGVSHLSVNGMSVPIEGAREVPFEKKFTTDTDTIELVAVDRLGNQTSALVDLSLASARSEPVMLASADTNLAHFLMAGLFGPKDTRPPHISLRGWTDTQTVFLKKVYLEGQASDENKIVSLSINQAPILRNQGKTVLFSHLAELQEGENTITIEARDEAGNMANRKITVIRRVPKALQLAERLSLTVLPFEQKGTVSEASLFFQDNLIDALVDQNRFRVVERDKLDMILQEQKLSRTKLVDRSTALRLGKLIASQSIIIGSIIETRTGMEIVARMIDTETSEILTTQDVYGEIKDLPALRTLTEGLAIKFHRDFPLVDGLVMQRKGTHIFTDLGQEEIRMQRRLLVYREETIKHPVTGKILGADNEIIGQARVTQVMPEMSKARILDDKGRDIKPLDKVITQ